MEKTISRFTTLSWISLTVSGIGKVVKQYEWSHFTGRKTVQPWYNRDGKLSVYTPLEHRHTLDSGISLLNIYPEEIHTYVHQETYIGTLLTLPFIFVWSKN